METPLSYQCPFCDCEVRVGKPCPGCAAKKPRKRESAKAGAPSRGKSWEQGSAYDGLDLPDDEFDYDDFVAREFGAAPHKRIGVKWYWWLLGVITLAGLAATVFGLL